MTTQEVAPGIFRIESILGPRPFAQYLLRDERSQSQLLRQADKQRPSDANNPDPAASSFQGAGSLAGAGGTRSPGASRSCPGI